MNLLPFRPNERITSRFLFCWLNSDSARKLAINQASINTTEIRNFELLLSPLEEQSRIAEVLITLDTELEGLRGQLERVKMQKKGLMQHLLTGKTRVKV